MKKVITKKVEEKKKAHGKQTGWILKPLKSKVIICACGNRYIITRPKQTKCVSCLFERAKR